MPANEEHLRARTWKLGSTWVGATPPCRAVASADAALVAPTHVQALTKSGTESDPNDVLN